MLPFPASIAKTEQLESFCFFGGTGYVSGQSVRPWIQTIGILLEEALICCGGGGGFDCGFEPIQFNSMASRRRRGAGADDGKKLFEKLPAGTRAGLELLVGANKKLVAEMLQSDSSSTAHLCERCAGVLKQQQLSPDSFLARFFPASVLSEHSILLGKSGNGNEPALAERIGNVWARNPPELQHLLENSSSSSDASSSSRKQPGTTSREISSP